MCVLTSTCASQHVNVVVDCGNTDEPGPLFKMVDSTFKDTIVARFLPGFVVVMVWFFVVTYPHGPVATTMLGPSGTYSCVVSPVLGTLWDNFFEANWSMTLAMMLGSLIAGSTPLGGGVVAFPVAVLALGLSPSMGRDFTVLIQTVGMNAAAYLLMLRKPHLLDFTLISAFVVIGTPGVLIGLFVNLAPFYVMLAFQVLIFEFAIVFFYLNVLSPIPAEDSNDKPPSAPVMNVGVCMDVIAAIQHEGGGPTPIQVLETKAVPTPDKPKRVLIYGLMVVSALAGGFLTASVGSGSDILLFAYGHLVWNLLMPDRAFKDNELTASSVITMGLLSLVTSLCRVLTRTVETRVYEVWGATAWVVCFGAPIGSLLITPALQAYLRIAFYLLAIGQCVGFAILKISSNPNEVLRMSACIVFGVLTAFASITLVFHRIFVTSRLRSRGVPVASITLGSICGRLLPNRVG